MTNFWLFRSNLKQFEYYHSDFFTANLATFEKSCHDFYILQLIYYLRYNYINQAIVWRLNPKKDKKTNDIVFDVNGRKLINRFVDDFHECLRMKSPDIIFWRGGFQEYDKITRNHHNFFGPNSLYLGAGRRVLPQYGGRYNRILVESDEDLKIPRKGIYPFYKTANPNIFYDKGIEEKKYDLCLPANFKQMRMKGQDWFLERVSKSKYLRSLKIVIPGDNIKIGKELTKKYGLDNVKLVSQVDRKELNRLLNVSKFGIITSNEKDGSPRMITEILQSGTPLLIRDKTRCLSYYKNYGCIEFGENDLEEKIKNGIDKYENKKEEMKTQSENLTIENICKLNWENYVI